MIDTSTSVYIKKQYTDLRLLPHHKSVTIISAALQHRWEKLQRGEFPAAAQMFLISFEDATRLSKNNNG